jgi:16S rRNA (guanine527-N7)-methyltransferase
MHPARIAELLQPFLSPTPNLCHSESGQGRGEACPERSRREPAVLSLNQLQHISRYIDILHHWNARINLTAVREPEEIVTRHFGESLFAARHLFPQVYPVPSAVKDFDFAQIRLADLGSGAGFPGLPIKLWAPSIALTLIESNLKKAIFLREVSRALALTDVNIQNARAETLPPSTFDVVTLRAVERFVIALPVAAALLAPRGRLALLISSSQLITTNTTLPAFTWETPILVPGSQSRLLLLSRQQPA